MGCEEGEPSRFLGKHRLLSKIGQAHFPSQRPLGPRTMCLRLHPQVFALCGTLSLVCGLSSTSEKFAGLRGQLG